MKGIKKKELPLTSSEVTREPKLNETRRTKKTLQSGE